MITVRQELKNFKDHLVYLCKWIGLGALCGVISGFIAVAFYICIKYATDFRTSHMKIVWALPLAGLFIALIYQVIGRDSDADKGTNIVIASINSDEHMPKRTVLLIFVSSVISHMFGASVGREGAALQMGAGIGQAFSELFHLNEPDRKIIMICGMSGVFSALFGTPVAASVFAMEVISVGIMHYAALVPCAVSSVIALSIAKYFGVSFISFNVKVIPQLTFYTAGMSALMGLICGILALLFCAMLMYSEEFLKSMFKTAYMRIFFAACVVVVLTVLFPGGQFNGAGTEYIAQSFAVRAVWYAFLIKMVFTAVSISGGFKGGEIIPSLFIGAVFGSFFSGVCSMPVGFCAAICMICFFCGVTNCPIASIIMAAELFGAQCLMMLFPAVAVSYMISGYFSIYKSQKIVYSKYRSVFVDRKAKR